MVRVSLTRSAIEYSCCNEAVTSTSIWNADAMTSAGETQLCKGASTANNATLCPRAMMYSANFAACLCSLLDSSRKNREKPLNSRSANQIAAAKYEAWACLSMLRWACIALRRSESIASAIARPAGPQLISDVWLEFDVDSIFRPWNNQTIHKGESNCIKYVLFAPS